MAYKIEIKTEFDSYEEAQNLAEAIKAGGDDAEVIDVTPCEAEIWHGPGHQSNTRCEELGPHTTHRAGGIPSIWGDAEWTDAAADDDGRVFTS